MASLCSPGWPEVYHVVLGWPRTHHDPSASVSQYWNLRLHLEVILATTSRVPKLRPRERKGPIPATQKIRSQTPNPVSAFLQLASVPISLYPLAYVICSPGHLCPQSSPLLCPLSWPSPCSCLGVHFPSCRSQFGAIQNIY